MALIKKTTKKKVVKKHVEKHTFYARLKPKNKRWLVALGLKENVSGSEILDLLIEHASVNKKFTHV